VIIEDDDNKDKELEKLLDETEISKILIIDAPWMSQYALCLMIKCNFSSVIF